MKIALVMGITGGFGGHVAEALARQGYAIRALMRDASKLPKRFTDVEIVKGDASNIDAVRKAAEGATLMVYAISPDNYHWKDRAIPWLNNAAIVAEEKGLTVLFPGNVYVFDPADGPLFNEAARVRPIGEKGAMRQAMEDRLKLAAQRGAKVIILRAGDFIGGNTRSSWVQALIRAGRDSYRLSATGPLDIKHSWAYLPDVADTMVMLAAVRGQLPAFSVFHFKGYQLSFVELAEAIRTASGKLVRVGRFPWLVIRLLSPFSAMFRGLVEMRYLWDKTINLDQTKLMQALNGQVPYTDPAVALVESGLVIPAGIERIEATLS